MKQDDSRAAKNIKKGWIILLKSTLSHRGIGLRRPYSKFEAWVWLLAETNWEDKTKIFDFGGKERVIDCPAGTVTHSERFIASAFGWSRKRLRSFLFLLENDRQISLKVVQQIRQITIVNWDTYRNATTRKEPARGPAGDQQGTSRGPNIKKLKEAKEIKRRMKSIIIRAEEFKNDIEKYIPAYGPELARSFFLYWSKKDKNEMMKFENEKMFEIETAIKSFSLAAYFKSTLDDDIKKKLTKKDIHGWLICFDECQRIDKYSYDQIHDIIEYFRIEYDKENDDSFSWTKNFQSPLKLRRLNKEGTRYINYFWEQIKELTHYGN